MSEPLDWLDEPKGSTEQPTPSPEPAAQPNAAPPPQAAPDPAPQPAAPSQPAAAPVEPATVPPGHVPLAALLDEREKRQADARERDDFKRKYEEATKKPAEPIDPLTDPDGFTASIDAKVAKAREDVRFEVTHMFAVQKHGADAVAAAEKWVEQECAADPAFYQKVARQPDPYDFMVKQHKRHLVNSQIGDDPDEFVKKRAAELGFVLQNQPAPETPAGPVRGPDGKFVAAAPPPATQTPLPKPSLASAPAASGSAPKVPTGPGAAFDSVFK